VARNAYVGFVATIAILLVHMLMYYSLLLMVSSRSYCRRLVEAAFRMMTPRRVVLRSFLVPLLLHSY
jgi:hypothetical protein